jgi:AcrR family transcriptional regulator
MPRPQSEHAGRAALDAARELLLEKGLEGFTVEAVAARSGVAKSTIYRRWASTHELLLAALHQLIDTIPIPNTGSLREDLAVLYRDSLPLLGTRGMRSVCAGMMSAADTDPEIAALHERLTEERHHPVAVVLELAIARGELPEGLDLELAEDFVEGPPFHRVMAKGGTLTDGELEQLVDWVTAGLRAVVPAASRG